MHLRIRSRVVAAIAIVLVATLLAHGTAAGQTSSSPRAVLTIHWGDETFPTNPVMDAAIRRVLLDPMQPPVNYYAEYLETENDSIFPEDKSAVALRDYIRQKYEGIHFDVVIANATPSLQFALKYRDELFPDSPLVFNAGFIPDVMYQRSVPGVTGVLNNAAFADTLTLALRLHPSTRQVFVVAQAPGSEGYEPRLKAALAPFSHQVKLTYVRERSVPGLLAAVKAIPPGGLIFYTRYTPLDAQTVVYSDEVARLMAQVSRVPIYSGTDLYIGTGVVGGMVRGSSAVGTRLGEIAREILDGTRAEDIPVAGVQLAPTFDWRQLQRWHIDPKRLPPGSDVRFRTPTPWESYREYVIATVIVLIAQLLLITALLAQRERRRRAEDRIRMSEVTLRRSYERIRHMAGRLINAQDEARASIARDLHDDVCQRLVCINMTVNGLKHSKGFVQDGDTQQALSELEHETNGMFDGIRRLSHELHPATLPVLGLAPTLKSYCSELTKRHNVRVSFNVDGELRRLRADVAVSLFRIAQEALRNAVAHGHAKHVMVSLVKSGEHVELSISDDGGGFDLEAVHRDGSGLGIVSMEERAHAVGADMHIVTAPGQGTTVRVRSVAETRATPEGTTPPTANSQGPRHVLPRLDGKRAQAG